MVSAFVRRAGLGLVAALLAAAAPAAPDTDPDPMTVAAPGPRRPSASRGPADRYINELGLTDEQMAKVKVLETERKERLRAAGDDRARRSAAAKWFNTEFRKVLTPEQREQYDTLTTRRRRERPDPIRQMAVRLGLTTEQQEKLRVLQPALRKRLKEAGEDHEARRAAWQWFQGEVKAVLTPEQLEKYEADAARLRRMAEQRSLMRVDWVLRELEFTQDQIKRIRGLRRERDEQVRKAYVKFKGDLKDVLTAGQLKEFETRLKRVPWRRPRSSRRPNNSDDPPSPPPPGP